VTNLCVDCSTQCREVCAISFVTNLFFFGMCPQPNSHTQLLTVEFEWKGVRKDKSSTLIGVSPEFELALYTLCFFAGQEDNYLQLGPCRVNIKCYRLGQDKIGSVFPIALD
jgi:poly(U)-specific endoribonuclease